MTEDQSDRKRAPEHPHWRRNMMSLTAGNLLNNAGFNAAFAFLPLVVKAMGVEGNLEMWVGAMVFGYYSLGTFATPVWGVLADHYGRKGMILRAGFGMGAGFGLAGLISDPLPFLFVIVLTGLANGYTSSSHALMATNTPREHLGGALALTQMGAWIGTMLGPLGGALLLRVVDNPHSVFLLTSATIGAAGLIALLLVREEHVRPAHALRVDLIGDIRRLAKVRELRVLYYLQFLFSFIVFGAIPVVSLFTIRLLDDSPGFWGLRLETWVAITAIGFTFASVVVLPFWGRLLDRRTPERVLGQIIGGTFITSLLIPLSRDPLELTVTRILFACFVAGMPPALIRMINDRAPQNMVARTLSYGTTVMQIGSALSPLAAGVLAPYFGLRGFFWLASGLVLVGLALWKRRERAAPPRAS